MSPAADPDPTYAAENPHAHALTHDELSSATMDALWSLPGDVSVNIAIRCIPRQRTLEDVQRGHATLAKLEYLEAALAELREDLNAFETGDSPLH